MVCEKCGKDNLEGRETCQECGAKLEAKGVLSYVPGGSNVATEKKHRGMLIASAAILVLLIAEIFIGWDFLGNLFDSDDSMPKSTLILIGYFFFWQLYVVVKGFTQENVGSVRKVAFNLALIEIVFLYGMCDLIMAKEVYVFIGTIIQPILLFYVGGCAASINGR